MLAIRCLFRPTPRAGRAISGVGVVEGAAGSHVRLTYYADGGIDGIVIVDGEQVSVL